MSSSRSDEQRPEGAKDIRLNCWDLDSIIEKRNEFIEHVENVMNAIKNGQVEGEYREF